MMRPLKKILAALMMAVVYLPADATVSDQLNRQNFRSSVCNIADMQISFRIEEAFGEPLVRSKMRWQAGPNTNLDCLSKLTHVWVTVRTDTDRLIYLKLRTAIMRAGQEFGDTATESPSWSKLFCASPTDTASCESDDIARSLFNSALRFEGFDVTTQARAVSNRATGRADNSSQASTQEFSFESLLSDAIDQAIAPTDQKPPNTNDLAPAEPVNAVAEQLATRKAEHASLAVNNVVSLLALSLAQYTTPAHKCESDRTIGNWVQARGTCQLNFRRESNYQYLCTDNGQARPVRSTLRANINLASDISHISDIRVSDEGWAALVLELNDELQSSSEGDFKTNRWQFAADSKHLADLQKLASSILSLREYCSANSDIAG